MLTNTKNSMIKKWLWIGIYLLVLFWSATNPHDTFTWVLEVAPAIIGFAVLIYTRNSFPFTPIVYNLILIHCIILMVGGHYTYAEVPLFDWIKETFDQTRNNYDKLGHLAQGFVPAMIAREIIIRKHIINGNGWTNFFVICFVLAFSAFYELIEWQVSLFSGEEGDAFLGTQGYIWDTQSDMAMALVGVILALLLLSRLHDKQIIQLKLAPN